MPYYELEDASNSTPADRPLTSTRSSLPNIPDNAYGGRSPLARTVMADGWRMARRPRPPPCRLRASCAMQRAPLDLGNRAVIGSLASWDLSAEVRRAQPGAAQRRLGRANGRRSPKPQVATSGRKSLRCVGTARESPRVRLRASSIASQIQIVRAYLSLSARTSDAPQGRPVLTLKMPPPPPALALALVVVVGSAVSGHSCVRMRVGSTHQDLR